MLLSSCKGRVALDMVAQTPNEPSGVLYLYRISYYVITCRLLKCETKREFCKCSFEGRHLTVLVPGIDRCAPRRFLCWISTIRHSKGNLVQLQKSLFSCYLIAISLRMVSLPLNCFAPHLSAESPEKSVHACAYLISCDGGNAT